MSDHNSDDNNDDDDDNDDDDEVDDDDNYAHDNNCLRSLKKRRPGSWCRKTGVQSLKNILVVLTT